MTTTEIAGLAIETFGAPITEPPPLEVVPRQRHLYAASKLVCNTAGAGAEDDRLMGRLLEDFGTILEDSQTPEGEPHNVYRAPLEEWRRQHRKPMFNGLLHVVGIDRENRIRDDTGTQRDGYGTIVYLGAYGTRKYLLAERAESVRISAPQQAIERLWEVTILPAIPEGARAKQRRQIAQQRDEVVLNIVNALSLQESVVAAAALYNHQATADEIQQVLSKVDRRTVHSTGDVTKALDALRAKDTLKTSWFRRLL